MHLPIGIGLRASRGILGSHRPPRHKVTLIVLRCPLCVTYHKSTVYQLVDYTMATNVKDPP